MLRVVGNVWWGWDTLGGRCGTLSILEESSCIRTPHIFGLLYSKVKKLESSFECHEKYPDVYAIWNLENFKNIHHEDYMFVRETEF